MDDTAATSHIQVGGASSTAGAIVSFVMDHVKLVIIIVVLLVLLWLVKVGFPRLNKVSNIQNMDLFLQENRILGKALEGLLNTSVDQLKGWDMIYGNREIFGIVSSLKAQVLNTYNGQKDPYTTALMEYFVMYDDAKRLNPNKPETEQVNCSGMKGSVTNIDFPSFYDKYFALKQSLGEESDVGRLSRSAIRCRMQTENDGNRVLNRIKNTGAAIEALAKAVRGITDSVSKTNIVGFLLIPKGDAVEKISRDLETYSKTLDEIYSDDFDSSQVHEYSWLLFEALSGRAPVFPEYDRKLNPLLINYLNSDAKKRALARNVLIRNDQLVKFVEKHPIYARIMLTEMDKSVNKEQIYSLTCAIYKGVLEEYGSAGAAAVSGLANRLGKLKEFYSNVAMIDLYLNQYQSEHKRFNRDTIKSIYKAKHMGTWDFFMYLWKPYWEDFILNKILMFFYKIFTKEYWRHIYLNKYYKWWMGIGNAIMNLPASMAANISKKRGFDKKKEKFIPESFIVEGFLGKIFGPLIAIGKFFMSLLKVVIVFAKLVMSIVTDPFGTLLDIFTLIISTVLTVIFSVVYGILSLPPFNLFIFWVYFSVTEVTKFILFTMIYGTLFLWVTVMILIVTFLNIITGGKLKNWSQCQNSPGAWYRTPNYHRGNKFERSILCARPCPTGYAPDKATGFMCLKLPRGVPNYCPKAEIMRIYTGYNRRDKKYTWQDYKTKGNLKYESKLPAQREKILLTHFEAGEEFMNGCTDGMNKYDAVPRAICASIDVIRERANEYGMSQQDVKRLERVCNQAYCNARTGGAYTVCSNFSEKSGEDISQLIKNICMIIFSVIIFTIVIVMVLYIATGRAELDSAFKL